MGSPEYTPAPYPGDDQAGVGTGADEAGPSEPPLDDMGPAAKCPRFGHFDEGDGEI